MILYLTGTGNTLSVARKVAVVVGEQRFFNVMDLPEELSLAEGEALGIFFPVHGWRPPKLLRSILSGLKISGYAEGRNYVYAVCTAGDTVGEAMRYLADDLETLGVTLDACFDVQMPNTYVGLPFMDVDNSGLVGEKLKASELRIRDVAKRIIEHNSGEDLRFKGNWPRVNSRMLGWLFADLLVTDANFHVDSAKCVRCGTCVKRCPTHDIKLSDGNMPEWKHNKKCMTCFACYHNCPQHAIQYGWMTHGKGQYRLP